jgi:hypothetical protein
VRGSACSAAYNRSHKPRLTHGCLFASGHHGPTVVRIPSHADHDSDVMPIRVPN